MRRRFFDKITLFNAEWSNYNGFCLLIFKLDILEFDRTFFEINVCKNFLYVSVLFFSFKVFDKSETTDVNGFSENSQADDEFMKLYKPTISKKETVGCRRVLSKNEGK